MFFDTHAHLNDDRLFEQRHDVLSRARQSGVVRIVNIGYDLESSQRAVALAGEDTMCRAAVGLHPHDATQFSDKLAGELMELARQPGVVAYGEIGLDYHYDNSPRDVQKQVMIRQLAMANELNLPVVIHNRESHADMLEILQDHPPAAGGVMHCFSGSYEFAKECVRLGLYISFAGPVTFKNAPRQRHAVEGVPNDRIMVETDCPYLSPEPHRGQVNEPANVQYVAEKIAEIKGLPLEEMAPILLENANRFFRLS